MKTATVVLAAIEMDCPYCGESLTEGGASIYVTEDEFNTLRANGPTIRCWSCEETVKLPANPFARKQRRVAA